MATTGYCKVGGGKDGGCATAMRVEATAARARAGATGRQQQRQEQGRFGNDSCKENSEGDAARGGNVVTMTGYPRDGGGKVGSDGGGGSNGQHGDGSGVPQRWRRQWQQG